MEKLWNISYQELEQMTSEEYQLVDIRDESSAAYGKIPGAVHIPEEELLDRIEELPKNKKIILYCMKGIFSKEAAARLQEKEIQVYSLEGGYTGWLLENMKAEQEKNKIEKHGMLCYNSPKCYI